MSSVDVAREAADPRVGYAFGVVRRWRCISSRMSLAAICVGLVVVVGVVKLGRSFGQQLTSVGDVAFIELGVRQAVHGRASLGVYSRFGWHHPGPALLYVLAPWYWLSRDNSRSLFLGAWLINVASALGSVWVVRVRAGETAARVMAGVVLAFLIMAGFGQVID